MGTNYYLRRRVEEYQRFHVCKASYGWRTLWQTSDDAWEPPTAPSDAPIYHSVQEIRDLLATGDWELVDEYGDERNPDEIDELCARRGHSHSEFLACYADNEGQEFDRGQFW